MKQYVKMLKKILDAEKVKFKEIDERIVNEEQLLEQAKVDKVAADAEIDTMAAMDAENRIQAHERALVMLRERRAAIMEKQKQNEYTSQLKSELQALEAREKLSNDEMFEQLQTLTQQIADIHEKYNQLYIDIEPLINEYSGYIRGELKNELIGEHRRFVDQKHRLYSESYQYVNNLFKLLQRENTFGCEQKQLDELAKVSSELSQLQNERAREVHQMKIAGVWDADYIRKIDTKIHALMARNHKLATSF